MSENDTGIESSETTEVPADAANDNVEARKPSLMQRISAAAAWLALLFAILALAASALDFLKDRGTAGETAASEARVDSLATSTNATREALATLEQSIAALTEADRQRVTAIESLGRRLDDRLRSLESMPGRLTAVETSLATVQGISTGAREAWLLAEAEYYMQIANAQLQLAGNAELARLALNHADERILQLADPRLTGVRQALSDELRALEVLEKPDTAGITLTLASLADVVNSLPLKQEVVTLDESGSDAIDPELSGMDRAMASLRKAVSGIVSVRRTDEALEPLMAPEAQYFLRANLALQLQAARLAILRGEEAIFRQSLDDADAWIAEYYDGDSTAVQSARETIAEIRGSQFDVATPDISRSLRLLRQFNAMNEAVSGSEAGAAPLPQAVEPESAGQEQ
jgi:uroporphyrin-3 C-methyltransferase